MGFERGHVRFEVVLCDEPLIDHLLAHIVDELVEHRPPVVSERIDMVDRVDMDVGQARFVEQAMRAPADKQVDALCR